MTMPELLIEYPDGERQPGYGSRSDLTRYLYSAGATLRSNVAYSKIANEELGEPLSSRIDLIVAIKEELETRLHSGQSISSLPHYLATLLPFLRFLEDGNYSFALANLETNYLEYAEYLFAQSRKKGATLNRRSAYTKAATLSSIFGSILEIPETVRLVNRTRLRSIRGSIKAVSGSVEKQNLEATFKQGSFLVDIVEGLSKEAVHGPLPLKIKIREGLTQGSEVLLHAGLQKLEWNSAPKSEWTPNEKVLYRFAMQRRVAVSDILPRKYGARRWYLVNLRVQAEFLIFVAQTGMNLTQAKELGRGAMKYKPLGDSWLVRCYKNRRGGEVSFQIYKSYKPFLERYRAFVNHFFPDSPYFFPQFVTNGGEESVTRGGLTYFRMLKEVVEEHGLSWITPRELRNTRVNWLLRRSGDPGLTAEMAQHTKEVLREKYERPSQQRAMAEVAQFWNKHDPILQKDLKASVIASRCSGKPESVADKPEAIVEPNCVNPSGCLWCKHHRDVDSEDYVWSLLSFRYLKTIEASMTINRNETPSDIVVNRLSEKILWFEGSSSKRSSWVTEAKERVEEGDYHPNWAPIIEFLEQ
jgi:hypothetical protein